MSQMHEPNRSLNIPEFQFPVLSYNDRDGGSSEGSFHTCSNALHVNRAPLTRKYSLAMLYARRAPEFGALQGAYESIGGSRTERTERRSGRHESECSSLAGPIRKNKSTQRCRSSATLTRHRPGLVRTLSKSSASPAQGRTNTSSAEVHGCPGEACAFYSGGALYHEHWPGKCLIHPSQRPVPPRVRSYGT